MTTTLTNQSQETDRLDRIIQEEQIRTVFQPIVDFREQETSTFSHEALTRGPHDTPFESATDLFNSARHQGRLYDLERVARKNAIRRLVQEFGHDEILFLNVDPNIIYDPSFRRGNTIEFMEEYGLDQNQVIFEITEHNQIKDNHAFEKAIRHYRNQGFRIAVDDVGTGYSNLEMIARLQPEFLKIDMTIIRELHRNQARYQLVQTITDFAERIETSVIAEGIETRKELETVLSLGIEFGQGYFLARPDRHPEISGELMDKINRKSTSQSGNREDPPRLEDIAQPVKTISPGTETSQLYQFFEDNPQKQSLVVVEEQRPVGLLMRGRLYRQLSTNIGQSLYWDRSVVYVMDDEPLVLPADTPVDRASEMLIDRNRDSLKDEIVVVDPGSESYRGNVTARELLQTITDLKTQKAKRANPLTGLPGNIEIRERIQQYLDSGKTFSLIYADLDHFKPFNDYYGFERGDQAILLLKNVLDDVLQRNPSPLNFLGHIGGDDFVLIKDTAQVESFCQSILDNFDQRIPRLYDPDDLEEGVIRTKDRKGNDHTFNLMTLSLAVVDNEKQSFENHLRMSEVAAEVKKYAKRDRRESSYEIDQRGEITGKQQNGSNGESPGSSAML